MHRQVDCDLAVTSITRRPRAVVVVIGEDLDHYTELYHTLECSTIAVETMTLAPWYEPTDVAISILREVARLIRMAQLSEMGMGNVPVMIHVVGNSGSSIIEALEQQAKVVLNEQASNILSLYSPSTSRTLVKNMNASTRSLFTTDTDPMSSDDEDDESSHEGSTIVETSSPLPSPCFPRQSSLTFRRRPSTSPSVHRIDMERTGISLQHSLNPEERAYRRDLEMFCSHMNLILWDMPPRKHDFMTGILMFLVFVWNSFLQIVFWGNRSSKRQSLPGMSLAREHALVYAYSNENQDIVRCLLQEATLVMNAKIKGSHNQHGAQYVAFVQETLDRISPPLSNEDDGFGSDEEE